MIAGWCTAPVTYGNGSTPGSGVELRNKDVPGAIHCAGFSAAGVAKPWECNGLYVRGPCYDHICEVFPNYTVTCRHVRTQAIPNTRLDFRGGI